MAVSIAVLQQKPKFVDFTSHTVCTVHVCIRSGKSILNNQSYCLHRTCATAFPFPFGFSFKLINLEGLLILSSGMF